MYTHEVPAATAQVRNGRRCDVGSDQGAPGRERRSVHVRGQAPDTRVQTPHGTPRLEEKNYTRHVRPHRVEKDGRHAVEDAGFGSWSQSSHAENPGL